MLATDLELYMQSQDGQNDGKPLDLSQFNQTAESEVSPARSGGSRPHGNELGEVEADTTPSNTVSNKYREEIFKPLRWGIDSLYLSFSGELFGEQESKLQKLKQLAQSNLVGDQAQAQIELNGHFFEVKDKGSGVFPFTLEDNCFRIQLSKASAKSMPMAYVKISSEYITHKKPEETIDDLRGVLNLLGNISYMPKVSRIDLFVDFASSFNMESWDRHAWVTRASSINQYSVAGEFSGWTVGLGGVMAARLYNKRLEIMASGKAYLVPLWTTAGWNPEDDGDVWRLEFQFKRDILSQFDIQALSSTMSHLNGLWSYATTEWLKLTISTEGDQNRSRWPIHPLWGYLSSVDFETAGGPLSREFSPQRVPSDRRLFDHGFSVLSSYMAREGYTDFHQGIRALELALYNYLNNRAINEGAYFDAYVEERIAAKARRFNSILNKLAETDDGIEDYANEYRKQSNG
jgi:hypothetical protein